MSKTILTTVIDRLKRMTGAADDKCTINEVVKDANMWFVEFDIPNLWTPDQGWDPYRRVEMALLASMKGQTGEWRYDIQAPGEPGKLALLSITSCEPRDRPDKKDQGPRDGQTKAANRSGDTEVDQVDTPAGILKVGDQCKIKGTSWAGWIATVTKLTDTWVSIEATNGKSNYSGRTRIINIIEVVK